MLRKNTPPSKGDSEGPENLKNKIGGDETNRYRYGMTTAKTDCEYNMHRKI
jgi:hypothetical protein